MKILKKGNHADQQRQLYDELLKEIEADLLPQYKRLYKETLEKLKSLFYEILRRKEEGTLIASDLYNYQKYFKVLNEIQEKIIELGGNEQTILEDRLVEMYVTNSRIVGSQFGLPPLSIEEAKQVLQTVWVRSDGLLFSQRIWRSTEKLYQMVADGVINAITVGGTVEDLAREIQKAYGNSWYDCTRLAKTELQRVFVSSSLSQYERAGIQYYKVLTAKDDKVCPKCKELAKKIWPVTQQVIPAESHPQCRCTCVAVRE